MILCIMCRHSLLDPTRCSLHVCALCPCWIPDQAMDSWRMQAALSERAALEQRLAAAADSPAADAAFPTAAPCSPPHAALVPAFPEIEAASPPHALRQALLPRSAPSGGATNPYPAHPYPATLPYSRRGDGYDPEAALPHGSPSAGKEGFMGMGPDGEGASADAPTPHPSRLPGAYRPLLLPRGAFAPAAGAAQRLDRATAAAVQWLQVSHPARATKEAIVPERMAGKHRQCTWTSTVAEMGLQTVGC